eukprot:scaffold112231_cov84-Phaeocystis_antarctica.AAC.3
MVVGGQNEHLVAMHSDVADGFVRSVIVIKLLRDTTCALDRGDDLQVRVKEDQRVVSSFGLSESIGPLSLLMHYTPHESVAIVGKRRHRRQLIHRTVQSELVQSSRWFAQVASQESVVGERQAHGPLEILCGETAGPVGGQRLWVAIVARTDEFYGGLEAASIARGDR